MVDLKHVLSEEASVEHGLHAAIGVVFRNASSDTEHRRGSLGLASKWWRGGFFLEWWKVLKQDSGEARTQETHYRPTSCILKQVTFLVRKLCQ